MDSLNISAEFRPPDPMPSWMYYFAILVQVVGIPVNIIVFVAVAHIRLGSQLTTKLLLTQCAFDCLTCLCALLKAVKPGLGYTGYHTLDNILCRIWFSYFTFWLFVLMSISNLVCTALDRLIAVVFNSIYQNHQTVYIALCYTCIVVYSISLASINPLLLDYRENQCIPSHNKHGNWIDSLIQVDSIGWPLLSYLIPCVIVISIYGKVINVLRKPQMIVFRVAEKGTEVLPIGRKGKRQRQLAKSLTIATSMMQTLFLITHIYDRVYYFLGIHHWIEYRVGSPNHLLGLWIITLNNCINPTALIFTMKPLRKWLSNCSHRFFLIARSGVGGSSGSD
ncbi:7 transmembrane receptor [Paragonimus heterotremus]|uniref:7 transmembrane receptor n=1 Tax=Paragonimus heterotremus TaxID=100268 RepID=A0A8J4X3Q9_9TREM|nr:7 transmembrane receptor [Paragonimus heterotremus]